MSLVSVIVPIYNVEKYLDKCINSIVNQTYKKLEIILVDDGSTDNCPEICDLWSFKDQRILVIHKKNGGLSDSRNYGIDIAHGKYLVFVDSDDYLNNSMVEILYKQIIMDNSDMAICGFDYVDDTGKVLSINNRAESYSTYDIWDQKLFWGNYYDKYRVYCVIAWNKMYKSELFIKTRYPVNKTHEDEFIIHEIIDNARKISCIPDQLYYYTQRKGSIMGSQYSAKRLDIIDALIKRSEFFLKNKQFGLLEPTLSVIKGHMIDGYNHLNDINVKKRFRDCGKELGRFYFKLFINEPSLRIARNIIALFLSSRAYFWLKKQLIRGLENG